MKVGVAESSSTSVSSGVSQVNLVLYLGVEDHDEMEGEDHINPRHQHSVSLGWQSHSTRGTSTCFEIFPQTQESGLAKNIRCHRTTEILQNVVVRFTYGALGFYCDRSRHLKNDN